MQPVDLSNFLLVRTRERLLLENKINAPARVLKKGNPPQWSTQLTQTSLKTLDTEIQTSLDQLQKILYVTKPEQSDLPVAFASNTLYVLERNGLGNKADYERVLLPILKKKIEYLHAEGVAQTVWALANAEIHDQQVWEGLKKLIL